MKALVVGGTGPTGPYLVRGLLDRGYEVTIFHRGTHETDELPPVEHIHGDPHFQDTIAAALAGRSFDLVLATYGRIRHIAEVMAGRCGHFIGIGGRVVYAGQLAPEKLHPYGLQALWRETDPLVVSPDESRVGYLVGETERGVFDLHHRRAFRATYFRYPVIYGPRQPYPIEWSVVKRVLDRQEHMIVADGGLLMASRCAARNAAHCVLLAVDNPEVASGQVYNCTDDDQLTVRQWFELVSTYAGGGLKMLSMPRELAAPFDPLPMAKTSAVLLNHKSKSELGYQDAISVREALRATVEWLLAHPVTPEEYPGFADRFDYAIEDRMVAAYQRSVSRLRRLVPPVQPPPHAYAHPTQGGRPRDHRGR